jgi:hypothetical protein
MNMARSKKDEAPEGQTEGQAPEESAEVETAPGEPGDVIDARLQMQEQGDDAVDPDAEGAAPGVDESEFDKDAEGQAQHENVVMAPAGLASGPTQDELNPAYAAPTKQDDSK